MEGGAFSLSCRTVFGGWVRYISGPDRRDQRLPALSDMLLARVGPNEAKVRPEATPFRQA